jgi:hypothetical protein
MKKGFLCLALLFSTLTGMVAAQETFEEKWFIPDLESFMDSVEKRNSAAIRKLVLTEGSKVDSIMMRYMREQLLSVESLDLSAADYRGKTIPPYIFAHWDGLKTLALPDSIEVIGEGAFYGSGLVNTIHIPPSVKRLGVATHALIHFEEECNTVHGVFEKCSNLQGVVFDVDGESKLEEIGIRTFSRCINLSGTIRFPASLKKIQPMAFYHCLKLDSLNLPAGLISLGDEWMALDTTRTSDGADAWERLHSGTAGAFSGCTGLAGNLKIPEGIKFIPNGTFANCSGLDGILTLPSSVVVIGASAFDGCINLHTKDSLDLKNVRHIGMGAFRNCQHLETLVFSASGFPETGRAAFAGCSSLKEIIPKKPDTEGQLITTTGSSAAYRTIKEKEEVKAIWGSYDFSSYYPEDVFQNTPFAEEEDVMIGVYVHPADSIGNDDTGDGRSWKTAFRTLQKAVQTLKDNTHWDRLILIAETDQVIHLNSSVNLDLDSIIIKGGFRGHEEGTVPEGKAPTFRSNGPEPAFRIAKNVKKITLANLLIDGFQVDSTLTLTSKGDVVLLDPNFKDSVSLYGNFTFDGSLTVARHLSHKEGIATFKWVDLNVSDSLRIALDSFIVAEKLVLPWRGPLDHFPLLTVKRPQKDLLTRTSLTIEGYDVSYADFVWEEPKANGEVYRLILSAGIELHELVVSPVSPTLSVGGKTLKLTLSSEIPPILRYAQIEWISDLPLVVEVDSNGLLTSGVDPGIATVTAIVRLPATEEAQGKEIGRVDITVYVLGLLPVPHRANVSLYETIQLAVLVYPSYLPDAQLEWTSDNPDIAKVDSNGLVQTFGESGKVLISAFAKGYPFGPVTFPLQVSQLTKTISLTSSASGRVVEAGFIVDILARCSPENVPNKSVEWTIQDTYIAGILTYTDTTCRIQAKKAGSTVISVKALDGSDVEIRYVLDVFEASTTNTILLSPSVIGTITKGLTVDFVAHRLPDVENKSVQWVIEDTDVADILAYTDTSCRIEAKEVGSTVLYVKALDGTNAEIRYLFEVFKGSSTAVSSLTALPRIRYQGGYLYLEGLNGHRGQVFGIDGLVKADFPICGDETHQPLHLPAGIYLFRTSAKIDLVQKFVVK